MAVLTGGCLAKRKHKYRLVFRFCIVLGTVFCYRLGWELLFVKDLGLTDATITYDMLIP